MQTKLGTYTSRKIEHEMCAAVAGRRYWSKDNTSVAVSSDGAYLEVKLHGFRIATFWFERRIGEPTFEVDEGTLAEWPTNTTISRLRALGADVRVNRRKVYLNGVLIATR